MRTGGRCHRWWMMSEAGSTNDRGRVDIPEPRRNRLLAGLPAATYDRLLPELESVALSQGLVLYDPGEPISHVYFPLTALASLLTLSEEGQAVEVAAVGPDGMVGLPLFLGLDS